VKRAKICPAKRRAGALILQAQVRRQARDESGIRTAVSYS